MNKKLFASLMTSTILLGNASFCISAVNDTLYPVTKGEKTGYSDKTGNFVIEPKFDYGYEFNDGLAWVTVGNKYGAIDTTGKYVIKPIYDYANKFNDGYAVVVVLNGNKYENELIDKTGKVLYKTQNSLGSSYSEGLLGYSDKTGKWGYIDKTGKVIIKPQFDFSGDFKEGLATVNLKGKYGFINKNGTFSIKPQYSYASAFSEGLAAVQIGEKWSYVNNQGKSMLSPKYSTLNEFNEGLAVVNNFEGKGAIIDKTGKELKKYDNIVADKYVNGILDALIDYRTVLIDKNFNQIWKQDNGGKFGNITIKEGKYKPSSNTVIYYPEISGLNNLNAQKSINTMLKKESNLKPAEVDSTYGGDFYVKYVNKDFLNIKLTSYVYYRGAAHGNPSEKSLIISLNNGKRYALKDLFKSNSNYLKIINDEVNKQIKETDLGLISPFKGFSPNSYNVYLSDKGIIVYFDVYEYTPYAAGFPEFLIPKEKLKDALNIKL